MKDEKAKECEHEWVERCTQGAEYIECLNCKETYVKPDKIFEVDKTVEERALPKNTPERIFLQLGCNYDNTDDWSEFTEVSWCKDNVNGNDIPYVLDIKGATDNQNK